MTTSRMNSLNGYRSQQPPPGPQHYGSLPSSSWERNPAEVASSQSQAGNVYKLT